jgi:hypothetical protein
MMSGIRPRPEGAIQRGGSLRRQDRALNHALHALNAIYAKTLRLDDRSRPPTVNRRLRAVRNGAHSNQY